MGVAKQSQDEEAGTSRLEQRRCERVRGQGAGRRRIQEAESRSEAKGDERLAKDFASGALKYELPGVGAGSCEERSHRWAAASVDRKQTGCW